MWRSGAKCGWRGGVVWSVRGSASVLSRVTCVLTEMKNNKLYSNTFVGQPLNMNGSCSLFFSPLPWDLDILALILSNPQEEYCFA